jgi:hypothetical protein
VDTGSSIRSKQLFASNKASRKSIGVRGNGQSVAASNAAAHEMGVAGGVERLAPLSEQANQANKVAQKTPQPQTSAVVIDNEVLFSTLHRI